MTLLKSCFVASDLQASSFKSAGVTLCASGSGARYPYHPSEFKKLQVRPVTVLKRWAFDQENVRLGRTQRERKAQKKKRSATDKAT